MCGIKAENLNDEQLNEYCKKVFKCFESESIASMPTEELEETELYQEAMNLQSIFTERGLELPIQ